MRVLRTPPSLPPGQLMNLALEKQAVGRVYRLGQSRPVTVTKLVLRDSIESRILDMQKNQARYSTFTRSAQQTSLLLLLLLLLFDRRLSIGGWEG